MCCENGKGDERQCVSMCVCVCVCPNSFEAFLRRRRLASRLRFRVSSSLVLWRERRSDKTGCPISSCGRELHLRHCTCVLLVVVLLV